MNLEGRKWILARDPQMAAKTNHMWSPGKIQQGV